MKPPSILDPLLPGETYLHLHVNADDMHIRPGGIYATALAEIIERAEYAGLDVTRGPEVMADHKPEYPGDEAWVKVVAIGRVKRLTV